MSEARVQKPTPKISIVLPTYNQASFLQQALESICNQTFQDFELIVVNDGSTDDSASILERFQRAYEFDLITMENQGLPSALNIGFNQSRGDYLTWTSSDNVMLPDMLKTLSEALDNRPDIGLVYADWYVIDEKAEVISVARTREYDRLLLLRDDYINACFLYRRACQEKVGLYDPKLVGTEDWDYWIRISRHFKMLHVNQTLYKFRIHESSLSANREHLVRYEKVAEVWKKDDPIAWYASKLKWRFLKAVLGRAPSVEYEELRKETVVSAA